MPSPGAGRGVVAFVISIVLFTACGSTSPTPSGAAPSSAGQLLAERGDTIRACADRLGAPVGGTRRRVS